MGANLKILFALLVVCTLNWSADAVTSSMVDVSFFQNTPRRSEVEHATNGRQMDSIRLGSKAMKRCSWLRKVCCAEGYFCCDGGHSCCDPWTCNDKEMTLYPEK